MLKPGNCFSHRRMRVMALGAVVALLSFVTLFAAASEADIDRISMMKYQAVISGEGAEVILTKVDPLLSPPTRINIETLTRDIFDMPEDAVRYTLWKVAGLPDELGGIQVIVAALRLSNPKVRQDAADLLVARGTEEAQRLFFTHILTETDPKVVAHMSGSLARIPTYTAISWLIKLLGTTGLPPEVASAVRTHLIKLTGVDLGDTYGAWSTWWLDDRNSSSFPKSPLYP